MKKIVLILLVAIALRVRTSPARGAITLCQACENVASHRLAGSWKLVSDLTERLTPTSAGAPERVSLTSDPSVLGTLPPEVTSAIGASQVFQAGTLQFANSTFSFLVTERAGNLSLLCFHPRTQSSSSRPITILFTIVPAKESRNDLLFLGGETDAQPFYAYERAERASIPTLSSETRDLLQKALAYSYPAQLDESLRKLPERPDWQDVTDTLVDALRSDPNSVHNNRLIVLRAIVTRHLAEVRIELAPLLKVLASPRWTNQQKTVDLLEALAQRPALFSGMERPLVRALIPLTTSQRGPVVNPTLDLLHQLTGKKDLQRDPKAWAHWYTVTYGEALDLSDAVYERVSVISRETTATGLAGYVLNGKRVGSLDALSSSVQAEILRAQSAGLRPSFAILVSYDITSAETQDAAMRESAPILKVLERLGVHEYTVTPAKTRFYPPFEPKASGSAPSSTPASLRENSGKLCAGAATWRSLASFACSSAVVATSP
jgi:hypothetical protein